MKLDLQSDLNRQTIKLTMSDKFLQSTTKLAQLGLDTTLKGIFFFYPTGKPNLTVYSMDIAYKCGFKRWQAQSLILDSIGGMKYHEIPRLKIKGNLWPLI